MGTTTLKLKLQNIVDLVRDTARDTANAIFEKSCDIHLPWGVVEQLQGEFDRIITLGSSNENYRAIAIVGIQNESLQTFLEKTEVSIEEASDILGEYINTLVGMLCDCEEFTSQFGYLNQAVPILYSDGHSYLPFIYGVQGYLHVGMHWVYVGFTLCSHPVE